MSAENVGKRCTWGSVRYSASEYGPHEGVIVAYAPPSASLRKIELDCGARKPEERRAADAIDEADGIPRYLVREDREGARGQKLKPRWYAPRCSTVKVKEEDPTS